MVKRLSYARVLQQAMIDKDIDTHDLADRTKEYGQGYGYEHLRKILQGNPSLSEDCNAVLSKILALDPEQMWQLATAEKIERRFGQISGTMVSPDNARMRNVWPLLEPSEQERLLKAAEGFVAQRNLEVASMTKDQINKQMAVLGRRLAELDKGHQPAQREIERTFGAKRKRR